VPNTSSQGALTYAAVVNRVEDLPNELMPLWRAIHDRLSSGRPVSTVRIGPLDLRQQAALADLLGLARLPGETATVALHQLDEVLVDSVGAGAYTVVSQLIGPVGDRAGDRARAEAERNELWEWLASHPVVLAQPVLAIWAQDLRRSGVIGGSAAKTREVLTSALNVIEELPAAGDPLPVLADRVLKDTHALDDDTRCAALVLKALALIYDMPPPANAQERRALWERAGVADDELSNVVLAAGIWATASDVASQILRTCAASGHVAALTLSQLRASALDQGIPKQVWVFENPSMLAVALARFGRRCPPIVVTAGWPNSAAIALLGKLAAAGATLRYHGDFDGEGLRIAANLAARTGAIPWRMTSQDYLAAVAEGPAAGRVTPAPWDADLAAHLTRHGVTVPEERLAESLLEALTSYLTPVTPS
jgi:uncharacterized protein (TIGR02679 family)